jgi:hypothetical protein
VKALPRHCATASCMTLIDNGMTLCRPCWEMTYMNPYQETKAHICQECHQYVEVTEVGDTGLHLPDCSKREVLSERT